MASHKADETPSATDTEITPVVEEKPRKGLTDQTNYLPRSKIISVFVTCAIVELVSLLDETMLAVALPVIASEFNAGTQISWVAAAYFVTSTACQLLYGRLSDIWSRKSTLFVLMAMFFIGNLASSVSKTLIQLLIFRAITGIGGGGLATVAQVIVSDVVSLRERGKYQGILGAAVALSNGIGPVIGGAFVQNTTWRWTFWLTLPLTGISGVFVWFFMPLKPVEGNWKEKARKIDYLGSLLILAGSTLTILALTWAGADYPWDSAHVLATLIIGGAVGVGFLLWEWKGPKYPLLPLRIFRSKVVCGAAITQWINGFLTMVQLYYLPTFYQTTYKYSAVKSGALLLPLTVVQTFASTISGLIISWTGRYRELILLGWAMWAIGLGLFTTLDANSPLHRQIGFSVLTGLGVGQTFQPSLVALQGALPREDMAVVTAMRSFTRNLGGTLGLAITGTILNNILSSRLNAWDIEPSLLKEVKDNPVLASAKLSPELAQRLTEIYREGFRVIFIVLASLAAFSFCVAFALLKQKTLTRADDEKLKEEGKAFVQNLKKKKNENETTV